MVMKMKSYSHNMKTIPINIWDDYEDGKDTYAYIEDDTPEEICEYILKYIAWNVKEKLGIENKVEYYDSKALYPDANHDSHFTRYQITLYNLSHEKLQWLVIQLNLESITFDNIPLQFYSES